MQIILKSYFHGIDFNVLLNLPAYFKVVLWYLII